MDKHEFERLDFGGFASRFMDNSEEKFSFDDKPLQIYPLSIASKFIKPPVPLFRANYNFLLLISRGGGRQQIDNEMVDLNPNDVLFIPEGHLNAIRSIDPDTDGYFLYIDRDLLSRIIADSALINRFSFYPKCSVTKADMEWLCRCCELLFSNNQEGHSVEVQSAIVRAILAKLTEVSKVSLSKLNRQSQVTMMFKKLLYENFKQRREVSFYADALAVSENYLNRCVKAVTNKPPKQHINEMVIVHSKILLQRQTNDIAQIAFDLNFSDPSHFGRLFKQITGFTPREYRADFLQGLSD